MHHLDYVEFYTTNVCNLNCVNCNRFNNFAFSGHEHWNQYYNDYTQWAKRITFNRISILGGEPMLNPTFIPAVKGVMELWPNSQINIITNGTQLDRWPELYDILINNKERVLLRISLHGHQLKASITESLHKFFQGLVTKSYDPNFFPDGKWKDMWEIIRGPDWPDCSSSEEFISMPQWIQDECEMQHDLGPVKWQDENGVTVIVTMDNRFVESAVKLELGKVSLHNSDPEKAVKICGAKFCHHFVRGQLYKCAITAVLPDFIKQFKVELSDQDRTLIESAPAVTHDCVDKELTEFLNGLRNGTSIDHCKFCPEQYNKHLIESGIKKIKLTKNYQK